MLLFVHIVFLLFIFLIRRRSLKDGNDSHLMQAATFISKFSLQFTLCICFFFPLWLCRLHGVVIIFVFL